jgi:predicted 3-demethylubiquinone-9 3-methyltransferase (glyoxalase superfamily)
MATSAKPFLMFEGNAQAAMDLYTSLFQNSQMIRVDRYAAGDPGAANTIKVATFTLCGREFMCSDSPIKHNFSFTPASSIFVECESKEELERAFNVLSQDGQVLMPLDNYGFSQCFGWLNDRFGVSWQLNLAA